MARGAGRQLRARAPSDEDALRARRGDGEGREGRLCRARLGEEGGRARRDGKAERKEAAAARRFEKKTLDSETAARAAKGHVLLRFDLANALHRTFARTLGVASAPRLLLVLPGEKKPLDLGGKASASSLAHRLTKHRERSD